MKYIKTNNKIIEIFLSILILVLCCININNLYGVVIVPDELGYWAAGYFLRGIDFSGVMGTSGYYGWGYGVLLSIILAVIPFPVYAYRVAVIVNGLLLVGCFLSSIKVSELLFAEIDKTERVFICFAVTIYSGYLYYSQTTYCEILVLFLFWNFVMIFLEFIKKKNIIYLIICNIILSFLFAVHLRTAVLFISFFILLSVLLILKKVRWRDILISIVISLFMIVTILSIKDYLMNSLYRTSVVTESLGAKGQLGKIDYFLSLDGVKTVVYHILGKLFYLGTASFLLFYVGVFMLLGKIKKYFIGKKDITLEHLAFALFILLSLVGEIILSSYSLIPSGRIDHVIYGRYTEFIMGTIILYGLCNLKNIDIYTNKSIIVFSILIQCIITISMYVYFKDCNELTHASTYAIPGIYSLEQEIDIPEIIHYTCGVCIMALFIFILYIIISHFKSKGAIIFLILCNIVVGFKNAGNSLYSEQNNYQKYFNEFACSVEDIVKDEDIYYIINDTEYVSWLKFKLKYFLPETNIIAIETNEYDNVPKGAYAIIYIPTEYSSDIQDSIGTVICNSKYFTLYKRK